MFLIFVIDEHMLSYNQSIFHTLAAYCLSLCILGISGELSRTSLRALFIYLCIYLHKGIRLVNRCSNKNVRIVETSHSTMQFFEIDS